MTGHGSGLCKLRRRFGCFVLGALALAVAPSASATILRYTFDMDPNVSFNDGSIAFANSDRLRLILDVETKDLNPDPNLGSFQLTSVRLVADEFELVSQLTGIVPAFERLLIALFPEEKAISFGVTFFPRLTGESKNGIRIFTAPHPAVAVPFMSFGFRGGAGVFAGDGLPTLIDLERAESSGFSRGLLIGRSGEPDPLILFNPIPRRASVTVVPEPATAVLLAAALVGTLGFGQFGRRP